MNMCDHHHSHVCQHRSANPSVDQTLEELEFERGIWTAALNGSREDVKKFLEKNIHVDSTDSSGYTALHYSSRNGHLDVCRLLLDHNASPNIQTTSGAVTPLHRAAYCGHTSIVQLLLSHGADPLLADADGTLPLHKAAERGHTEVVQLLLKAAPSSATYKDKRGQTAADCTPQNHTEITKLLIKNQT